MLRREGWDVGKDRLYRVYREEGLGLRRKRPWRHASAVHREVRTPAGHRNDVWSMDFVHDQLSDGRRFRALTLIDVFTRECLEIEVGQNGRPLGENVLWKPAMIADHLWRSASGRGATAALETHHIWCAWHYFMADNRLSGMFETSSIPMQPAAR